MRTGWLATSLLLAACFEAPPSIDDDGGDAASESGGDEGDPLECAPTGPPMGCVEILRNGGFDDWDPALPLPQSWQVSAGVGARAEAEASGCEPALELTAGAPLEDGVVWQVDQDFIDFDVEIGGHATFLLRLTALEGGLDRPRICFNANPASQCVDVEVAGHDGWITAMAELDALDETLTLKDIGLTSKVVGQVARIDDLRLWNCAP